MPFSLPLFKRLYELKGFSQPALAARSGVSQPQISTGKIVSNDALEKLADVLDCTTDFLLDRTGVAADESDDRFRATASRMAFDEFVKRLNISMEQRERCARVLGHPAAPITRDAWAILSEHIDLAIGPTSGTTLRSIRDRA